MKERIDVLLVNNGFYPDVEQAKRAVMAGIVLVNDLKIEKPGTMIKIDTEKGLHIRIKGKESKYVSRGGLKLEKAVSVFDLDFKDKVILDVGASTGGFTDCALMNGAKHVYAVDVGTNQLDWKLRSDSRVTSIENRHINELKKEEIDFSKIDYIVMDISFISITSVVKALKEFFEKETKLMALIKPQFEVEKFMIEKGGIVRDKEYHLYSIEKVVKSANENGLYLEALDISPIKGGKGNTEYLSLFGKNKKIDINVKERLDELE
ncbi:TlyA family RNA methyltransferase [Fusobacterium perfoetens]|uniref:TlyA family RNA methyltransferase n=1 Tax=Fusobacterium perfoetens TaxID=852 RepID=UPI00047FBE0D|nr:TlyA family RNA methyltransferase [Fusobacterium perfoetens]